MFDLNAPPEDVEVGERDADSQSMAVALAVVAQDTRAQVGLRVTCTTLCWPHPASQERRGLPPLCST